MSERRAFMKAVALAAPAIASVAAARADDGSVKDLMGGWTTLHDSPLGPFRELLVFSDGGGVTETNGLLHTNSNLTFFSQFGLPAVVNGSDGAGSWERVSAHQIRISFRKLLFDGNRTYFGDFWSKGTVGLSGSTLTINWDQIWIVNTVNQRILDLGTATSTGTRI